MELDGLDSAFSKVELSKDDPRERKLGYKVHKSYLS